MPNGDSGGYGGFGGFVQRSAQQERLAPTLAQQLAGWVWAVVFAVFAVFTLWAIIISIGPASVWFVGQAVIVVVFAWAMRQPLDDPDSNFFRVVFILMALGASIAWWFVPVREYWPPFMPVLQIWKLAVVLSFAVPVLAYSGIMSFSMLVGAVNPASYPPYSPRSPSGSALTAFLPNDPEQYGEEYSEPPMSIDDIRAVLAEALAQKTKPQVIERLAVMNLPKANGNGQPHTAQDQDTAQYYFYRWFRDGQTWLNAPEKEYPANAPDLLHLRYVKMADLVQFIRESDSRGASCQSWYPVWHSKEYWRESNNVLRRLGILDHATDKSDSALLVPKSRAMEILAAMNLTQDVGIERVKLDPPTPL